jgi:hypothetical protein
LKSLLADGGISPENVQQLAQISEEWFKSEPILTSFVLRAVFKEVATDWDEEQGIPTAVYDAVKAALLPELKRLCNQLANSTAAQSAADLDGLVTAFHASMSAAK